MWPTCWLINKYSDCFFLISQNTLDTCFSEQVCMNVVNRKTWPHFDPFWAHKQDSFFTKRKVPLKEPIYLSTLLRCPWIGENSYPTGLIGQADKKLYIRSKQLKFLKFLDSFQSISFHDQYLIFGQKSRTIRFFGKISHWKWRGIDFFPI